MINGENDKKTKHLKCRYETILAVMFDERTCRLTSSGEFEILLHRRDLPGARVEPG
jgi:hypothetical protein